MSGHHELSDTTSPPSASSTPEIPAHLQRAAALNEDDTYPDLQIARELANTLLQTLQNK